MDSSRLIDTPTLHAHKRQFAWQILVPTLVVAAILLAAGVLLAVGQASTARTWADISLIWLIAPALVFALVLVAGLGFLIYGFAKLLQVMPRLTGKTQDIVSQVSKKTRTLADGTAKPVIWLQQAAAVIKSIFNHK